MAATGEERYERVFAVGNHAELTLRNVRGSITVRGWDQPDVSVKAVKVRGTEWGASESFDQTLVEMEQDGSRVLIRTQRQGGGIFGWLGIGRTPPVVNFDVHVPLTSDISIRNVDGPITVTDIVGSVYLRAVDGDMTIERVSGQILTSAVESSLRGKEVAGTLALKSVSGNAILAQSRLSSLWSKTVSGSIQLETTIDPAGTYETSSVSGSLHLLVPPDSRANAEMHTVSGRAACDLPCTITEQGVGQRRWAAVINGGGARIYLKSVDGSLKIEPTTALAPVAPVTSAAPEKTAAADQQWPEMSILKAVERGELTVEEAIARLAELDKGL